MAGVNKAIIVGRLGQDPEIRYFQDGSAVANFSVATSEEWKDKETGEKRERTEWHRIVAYRRLAEICGQYLSKGRQVYIEGRIQTREWDDRDGNKRYTTEIVANIMQMLGSRADAGPPNAYAGGGAPGGYNRSPQGNQANQANQDGGYPGGSNPGGGRFPGGPMGGEPQTPNAPAEKGYPDDGGVKGTPQPDPGPDDDDIPF